MFIKCLIGTSAFIASLLAGIGMATQPESAATSANKIGGEPPVKPLAFVICAFEGAGAEQKCAALGGSPTYTVPSNRTFVIEQVTGNCGTDDLSAETGATIALNVVTGGVLVDHLLIAPKPEVPAAGFLVSDDTHIYADRGSTIALTLFGVPVINDRFCRLAFSGRLVR